MNININTSQTSKFINLIARNISFEQKRLFNCTPNQIQSSILDVNKYKLFIPFVSNSSITKDTTIKFEQTLPLYKKLKPFLNQNDDQIRHLIGRLDINFKFTSSSYQSDIWASRDTLIYVQALDSTIFRQLEQWWLIEPCADGDTCNVHFKINFEFHNSMFNQMGDYMKVTVGNGTLDAFQKQFVNNKGTNVQISKTIDDITDNQYEDSQKRELNQTEWEKQQNDIKQGKLKSPFGNSNINRGRDVNN